MKSIVIGMGIGGLYKAVLESDGNTVVTVDTDPAKGADFTSVQDAIEEHKFFDTAHVCTPNFTHDAVASEIAPHARIVFVEKPGSKSKKDWCDLVKQFPSTRFMMVKNNQWRSNFAELKEKADASHTVRLNWINKNRVPNPGSWFTTKSLSFGGVSRDLMPHLLSWVSGFEPGKYKSLDIDFKGSTQRWLLEDLIDSDYGTVNPNGTYDVDDRAELTLTSDSKKYKLIADWKSNTEDDISLNFDFDDGTSYRYELGLCPEDAYLNMINMCFKNLNNEDFWDIQLVNDLWIHELLETL